MRWRLLFAGALAALAAGCTTPGPGFGERSGDAAACAAWFGALDAAVDASGVRDAQHSPVAGFPYLRVDRLHASLRDRAAASEAALQDYMDRLRRLDLESRRFEIANLPRSSLDALPGLQQLGRDASALALSRSQACGQLLQEADLSSATGRAAVLEAAVVPDDYSAASRVFGLYPVTRLPFAAGVRRWERETRASFEAPPSRGRPVVRYSPASPLPAPPRSAVAALLGRAELEPLGIPVLQESELARLAAAYAPSFEISIAGDYDRFGALRWRRGGAVPEVDAADTVAYVYPSYARYREASGTDRILLQLVYTIWFAERPPQFSGDILAGRLDGLVWRVTLAPDGEPILYDSMHACGCFHEFFPTPRARARAAPDGLEEWAFVPKELPRVASGERPLLRIAPATHYLEDVDLVRGSDSVVRYALRSYDELRSLQRMEGGRQSAFGPDGLVAGSERPERFLFWPMGVRSAGAMRQAGRHATAFVGRRHFDDADLVEKRFDIDLTP